MRGTSQLVRQGVQALNVVGQRGARAAQPALQPANLDDAALDRARNGLGPNALLTMAEAAVYLRYHREQCPPESCRCADICRLFLQRHGLPLSRRGRTVLVRQRSLDEVLNLPKGVRWIDHQARRSTMSVAR